MEYRVAKIEDLEAILEMKKGVKVRIEKENLPIWLNGYPLDEMIKNDLLNGEGRVVLIDDEIISYACFHHANKEYPLGTFKKDNLQSFGRVMVKNGYTGKHIASFLVKNMIEEAKKLPVEGLGILADECNIKAVKLYQKQGFQKEGAGQFPYAYLDIYALYF